MQNFIIRQEKPADYEEVRQLIQKSFATNADDDGTTHDYMNELRNKDVFIPELSLVAEHDDGTLAGQIVLYKTAIYMEQGENTQLLLSPICVHPDYFRQGIARAMIDEAMGIAKDMGYKAVFLCGNPDIYEKMGFIPTCKFEIYHKDDEALTAEWSMVRELYRGALSGVKGTVDTI